MKIIENIKTFFKKFLDLIKGKFIKMNINPTLDLSKDNSPSFNSEINGNKNTVIQQTIYGNITYNIQKTEDGKLSYNNEKPLLSNISNKIDKNLDDINSSNNLFELQDPITLAEFLFNKIKDYAFPLIALSRKHYFKIMKDNDHLIKCVFMPFEKGGQNFGYELTKYPLEEFEQNIKEICGNAVDLTCVLEVLEKIKYIKKEEDYWILDTAGEYNIIFSKHQELLIQNLIKETMEKYK